MRKILSVAFIVISLFCVYGQADIEKPDFAYPRAVLHKAGNSLQEALSTGNTELMLRATIDMTLADLMINQDSIEVCIDRIKSLRNECKNELGKSMFDLFLACVYSDYFFKNRWKINRRLIPDGFNPAGINEWDTEMFEDKIEELLDSVLNNKSILTKFPLKDLGKSINADKETYAIFTTAYDFAAYKSIELLRQLPGNHDMEIKGIYRSVEEEHEEGSPAWIYAKINEITDDNHLVINDSILKRLWDIYDLNRDREYSCYVLQKIQSYVDLSEPQKRLYEEVSNAIKSFPGYRMRNCLENILLQLGHKNIMLKTQQVVTPGDNVNIEITSHNIDKYVLSLYKINKGFDPGSYFKHNEGIGSQKIESKTVKSEGRIPFRTDTTVSFILSEPGYYYVTASFDGQSTVKNPSYGKIFCSGYESNVMKFNKNTLVVVNPKTGVPQNDVDVFIDKSERSSEKFDKIGRTDHSGFYALKNDDRGTVSVRKGNDVYARTIYLNSIGNDDKNTTKLAGFTDLGVYHPGDSVRWVAIIYDADNKCEVVNNAEVIAILKDATYQPIDTFKCVSDEFGRVTGTFKLPEDKLTGRYSIELSSGNGTGRVSFEVSDYKLPTFDITVTNINTDISSGKSLEIEGIATAYSGMPIADAKVTASIVFEHGWWRLSSVRQVFSEEGNTNYAGSFKFEVPAELLSVYNNGRFKVNLTVTSETGESHQISKYFSLKPSFGILAALQQNINIESPVRLNVRVVNQDGMDTTLTVGIKLSDTMTGKKSFETVFLPGEQIDLRNLPSGVYDASFWVADNDCDTVNLHNIGFYRPTDPLPPKNGKILWVADTKIDSGKDLLLGTYEDNTWVLYTLWTENEIIEQKWIECNAGFQKIPIRLPDDVFEGKVTLVSTFDYKTAILEVTVNNKDCEKGIEIVTESFRDRLTPGDEETWTIRVLDKSGIGSKAGVIVDMYNAAIEQIMGNNLIFNPIRLNKKYFSFRSNFAGPLYSNLSADIRYLNCIDIQNPDFQIYGYGFMSHYPMPLMNGMKLMSRTTGGSDKMIVEDAVAMAENAIITESSFDTDEGTDESDIIKEDTFDYRPSEIALAFFNPTLTTDVEGNVSFTFKVPDANTTWRFKALAFTKDLLTNHIIKDAVASKKIMVSPNLPRFLRNGDKIIIKASVFNNTDSNMHAITMMEFFNPITGERLNISEFESELKERESTMVETEFHVPDDLNFIGFKIKSAIDSAADGEQSLIPVLPSMFDVVDSEPFFIEPDEREYKKEFGNLNENDNIILEYCDNPIWFAVTALPGLVSPSTNTGTDIAAALFSTVVAGKLPDEYPIIKNAVRYWGEEGRKDSMLVSALEKNQELKTMLLGMTLWQSIANGETEQMEQLAMIFDKKQVESSFAILKERLATLQQPDGGFAWASSYERSSEWSTLQILTILGQLNQMKYMPCDNELNLMIDKALGYVQSINVKACNMNNNGNFTDFARLCVYFPDFKRSTSGEKVYRQAIQNLVKNWSRLDIKGKAQAALILYAANYRTLSKEILKSLEQYSVKMKGKGIWWANSDDIETETTVLEAYSTIEPSSEMIKGIIERMIFQKLNQMWDNGFRTTATVAMILKNSLPERSANQDVVVKIDGKTVSSSNSIFSGEIKLNLSEYLIKGSEMILDRQGNSPAWGAVYRRYISDADSIESVSSGSIVIKKSISVLEEGLKEKTTLKTGDRVRVTLTLTVLDDADFVTIVDERAACMEPVEQLPKPIYQEGLCFYRENADSSTKIFIDRLPKGAYFLKYDLWVNNAGTFTSGIATVQSQYSPRLSAHSGACKLTVTD